MNSYDLREFTINEQHSMMRYFLTNARYASATNAHTKVNKYLRIADELDTYNFGLTQAKDEQYTTAALDKIIELREMHYPEEYTLPLPKILEELLYSYLKQQHEFESL